MKIKGSIIADEIVQSWRREIYYKKLAERKKENKENKEKRRD